MATTDFQNWIDDNVENIEDAYCLKQCIQGNENFGSYDISSKGERIFVKAFGETLMLASAKAKDTFLSMLESQFAAEGLDIDSTYEINRQMSKPD